MLKKVKLTNIYNDKTSEVIVDTDSDGKAVFGAGKAPNETAEVTDIMGADEYVHRISLKKGSLDEAVALFSSMARCLDRNISLNKSFELVAGRLKSPRYRGAVADINQSILAGETMGDAFAQHPDLFTEDVLALIRAGEESGQINQVFRQITSGREKSLRILRKLRSGMIYPVIVIMLAVVVVIVMSFTLVPSMSKLYSSMNVDLPLATRVMSAFSDLLVNQPYMAAVPIVALLALFKNWGKIYAIPQVQRFFIRVPTVGNLIRKTAAMVSFRILALLLQANVRVATALEIAGKSSNHVEFEEFFTAVKHHIQDGLSMPESFLMESHRLGADGRNIAAVVQMASETGSMNEVLDELATDYEEELDTMAAQIDKLLEPFILVILGTMVGGIIYAIYGPMFSLGKVLMPQKKGPPGASAPAVPGR
ncbi:MAG: type II secretion system F family protein [Chthoniobacterales bacterium]|nr:type II secretion system F family protein [Chthoniobacterales bacterium]